MAHFIHHLPRNVIIGTCEIIWPNMSDVTRDLRRKPIPAGVIAGALCIFALACAMQLWSNDSAPRAGQDNKELIAKGKKLFDDYRCFDCHGMKGEGADDGPDLTASHLTAAEVSKFLERPSADADARGMPSVPTTSPDHEPLVAFVMSLRKPPPK
jgi:mono/diheme cytochrome c family protein